VPSEPLSRRPQTSRLAPLRPLAVATLLLAGWEGARADEIAVAPEPEAIVAAPEPETIAEVPDPENLAVPLVPFDPEVRLAQGARDPSIETVDEMTARPPAGGRSGQSAAGNWWDSIRDPAIQTVDEQTHGAVKPKDKEWYERINIRGYTQFRINSVLWNDESQAEPYHPADRSVGPNGEFFIRRCRIIFSGDLSDRL